MDHQENKEIGVILLAAGNSSRLGRPKQLLLYHGTTLIAHALNTIQAAGFGATVVVTGALNDELVAEVEQYPVTIVHNQHWESGMASSVQTGLNALTNMADYGLKGTLIMLCDQPLITPAHLRKLAYQFKLIPAQYMIATGYDGVSGVPAIFGNGMFPYLHQLTGDQGARQLFTQHCERLIAVNFEDASIDVDTEEDYERLPPGLLKGQ